MQRLNGTAVSLILMALAGLAAPAVTAASLPAFDRVRIVNPPKPIEDFTLTDQTGQPFQFSSLRGRPVLVAFGFTNCPDVCPMIMGNLKNLMSAHGEELDGVQVVLISVDGERDTPEAMRDFLAFFSPDFLGLTGDPALVRQIAGRFPAVFFKEAPAPGATTYNVTHTIQVFALDAEGRVRAEFYNASLDAMAAVSRVLLDESR